MNKLIVFAASVLPVLWLAKQVTVLVMIPWLFILLWYFNRPALMTFRQINFKSLFNTLYGEQKKPVVQPDKEAGGQDEN